MLNPLIGANWEFAPRGSIPIDLYDIRQQVKLGIYDPTSTAQKELTSELTQKLEGSLKTMSVAQCEAEKFIDALQDQKVSKQRPDSSESPLPESSPSLFSHSTRGSVDYSVVEGKTASQCSGGTPRNQFTGGHPVVYCPDGHFHPPQRSATTGELPEVNDSVQPCFTSDPGTSQCTCGNEDPCPLHGFPLESAEPLAEMEEDEQYVIQKQIIDLERKIKIKRRVLERKQVGSQLERKPVGSQLTRNFSPKTKSRLRRLHSQSEESTRIPSSSSDALDSEPHNSITKEEACDRRAFRRGATCNLIVIDNPRRAKRGHFLDTKERSKRQVPKKSFRRGSDDMLTRTDTSNLRPIIAGRKLLKKHVPSFSDGTVVEEAEEPQYFQMSHGEDNEDAHSRCSGYSLENLFDKYTNAASVAGNGFQSDGRSRESNGGRSRTSSFDSNVDSISSPSSSMRNDLTPIRQPRASGPFLTPRKSVAALPSMRTSKGEAYSIQIFPPEEEAMTLDEVMTPRIPLPTSTWNLRYKKNRDLLQYG